MRKTTVGIGDIVKFIGTNGKSALTKCTAILPNPTDFDIDAELEMLDGPKKGHVGYVRWASIKWNGKMFVADLRPLQNVK